MSNVVRRTLSCISQGFLVVKFYSRHIYWTLVDIHNNNFHANNVKNSKHLRSDAESWKLDKTIWKLPHILQDSPMKTEMKLKLACFSWVDVSYILEQLRQKKSTAWNVPLLFQSACTVVCVCAQVLVWSHLWIIRLTWSCSPHKTSFTEAWWDENRTRAEFVEVMNHC